MNCKICYEDEVEELILEMKREEDSLGLCPICEKNRIDIDSVCEDYPKGICIGCYNHENM